MLNLRGIIPHWQFYAMLGVVSTISVLMPLTICGQSLSGNPSYFSKSSLLINDFITGGMYPVINAPIVQNQLIIQDDFESGYGNWNDGGNDCTRVNIPARASSGNISVRLRDNSNTSFMTTDDLALSTYDTVRVSFHFFPFSFETDEDFWLQISTDGGGSYTTVRTWVVNNDFVNNVPQNVSVAIPGTFTDNTRVRIRCDATANGDQVYIDDVVIEACEAVDPVVCPTVSIPDESHCAGGVIQIVANPTGGNTPYLGHQWTDLGTGSSQMYVLSNQTTSSLSLDLTNAIRGDIDLEYRLTGQDGCVIYDTLKVVVESDPLCEIESLANLYCEGAVIDIDLVDEYVVTPMSGFVPAGSNVGVTVQHEIIGIKDPNSTRLTITLPTWDDHFDEILLNGNMIIPEVFEQDSYNANGMNCLRPWNANVNGLPRSIIIIESGSVRYFSSLTVNSTVMTEVMPSNWNTTPQNFIEGNNTLQFGIQNTAGPVSGSWNIVAESNVGYTYLWNTGETTQNISVNADSTQTYTVTVTGPSGCQSVCGTTVTVSNLDVDVPDHVMCFEDTISVNGIVSSSSSIQSYQWEVIGVDNGILLSNTSSSTLVVDGSSATSGEVMLSHTVTSADDCVEIDTFILTVLDQPFTSIDYILCQGDTVEVDGLIITEGGVFSSEIPTMACDSIIEYNVTVSPRYTDTITHIGCEGDGFQVVINGVTYNEANPSGEESMPTVQGCDSIIVIDLLFNPSFDELRSYQGCSDDGYSVIVNGTIYDFNNPSGVEVMQTTQGCDSIVTIDLQYDAAAIVEAGLVPEAICSNTSVDLSSIGASITGGVTTGTWTSGGGGVFDGGGDFDTALTYEPSVSEIEDGVIILTLTSDDPPGGCEPDADAVMIYINDLRCSDFPWAGN